MVLVKPDPSRKGWFIIPGVQPIGDRTIAAQMKGLDLALAGCAGKTVLDLGCAEGAISFEFAKAGAKFVLGLECNREGLIVARWITQDFPNVQFQEANLNRWVEQHPEPQQYDIVLALGVVGKLQYPDRMARFIARSSRDLICFRAPGNRPWDGLVISKHYKNFCNWFEIMKQEGFRKELALDGSFGEAVEYWKRA